MIPASKLLLDLSATLRKTYPGVAVTIRIEPEADPAVGGCIHLRASKRHGDVVQQSMAVIAEEGLKNAFYGDEFLAMHFDKLLASFTTANEMPKETP
jgi:hypothetical protein